MFVNIYALLYSFSGSGTHETHQQSRCVFKIMTCVSKCIWKISYHVLKANCFFYKVIYARSYMQFIQFKFVKTIWTIWIMGWFAFFSLTVPEDDQVFALVELHVFTDAKGCYTYYPLKPTFCVPGAMSISGSRVVFYILVKENLIHNGITRKYLILSFLLCSLSFCPLQRQWVGFFLLLFF